MVAQPRYGLAGEGIALAKRVLVFASLGIFAKLLQIDLSELQILGLSIRSNEPSLIPGFLGLCLLYSYIAFLVSRGEAALDTATDKEVVAGFEEWQKSKFRVVLSVIALPFTLFVYCMPYALGALGIYLLGQDSIVVLGMVWAALCA